METIKFRGKRVDNNQWAYGYFTKHKNVCYIDYEYNNSLISVSVIPETVGQYVGLTDKNGKEIYSGDYDKDYNLVHWCDKRMGWAMAVCDIPTKEIIMCHCYSCEGNFEISEIIDEKIEIIGNIYENQ